jgi:hypothetical protein
MTSEASGKRHLFICGCPRSGTSALQLLLASHPRIALGGERYIIGAFRNGLRPEHFTKERFFDLHPDDTFYPSLDAFGSYYADQRAKFDDALWIGDKAPDYFRLLDHIDENFDDAHIILIVRDPVAVASSYQVRASNEADTTWDSQRDFRKSVDEWNTANSLALAFHQKADRRAGLTILDYSELFDRRASVDDVFVQLGLDCPGVVRSHYRHAVRNGRKLKKIRKSVLTDEQLTYVKANADFDLAERLLEYRLRISLPSRTEWLIKLGRRVLSRVRRPHSSAMTDSTTASITASGASASGSSA